MTCTHEKSEITGLTKKYKTDTFSYQGKKCSECGSSPWTHKLQKEYLNWLNDLFNKSRDKFEFKRIEISEYVNNQIEKIQEEIPGVSRTAVIKAMVFLYQEFILPNEKLNNAVEELYSHHNSPPGETTSDSIRLKPAVYLSLQGTADLIGTSIPKYISEACNRITCTLMNSGEIEEYRTEIGNRLRSFILASS